MQYSFHQFPDKNKFSDVYANGYQFVSSILSVGKAHKFVQNISRNALSFIHQQKTKRKVPYNVILDAIKQQKPENSKQNVVEKQSSCRHQHDPTLNTSWYYISIFN